MDIKSKIRRKSVFFLICCLSVLTLPALAQLEQEDETGAMLFGSWENQVTTVSKKAEDVSEAPAIISVLTAEQIEMLGVQQLRDVFRYLPGVEVMDTYWRGPIISFRGVYMSHYNDKALMLINGIPAYEAVNGEYYPELVPMNAIKQIEVIRGPGSVLYGTNAFSGVINIITKDGTEDNGDGASVYAKGGSFSLLEGGITVGKEFENEASIFLATSYRDDDGYEGDAIDENGDMGTLPYELDILSVQFQAAWNDFTFTTNYLDRQADRWGLTPVHNRHGGRGYDEAINLSLQYDKEFSEDLSFTTYVRYNDMSREQNLQLFPGYIDSSILAQFPDPNWVVYEGSLIQGEMRLSYNVNEAVSVISGLALEELDVGHVFTSIDDRGDRDPIPGFDGSLQFPPPKSTEFGAYVQADYKTDTYGLVAGVRYTDSDQSGDESITPRAGVVYHFNEDYHLKVLYGQAFRSPVYVEKYFEIIDAVYGNEDLDAETIETYEVALDFNFNEDHSGQISFYYLNMEDSILRRFAEEAEITNFRNQGVVINTGLYYDNLSDQRLWGFEFDFKGNITDTLRYFTNFSIREGEEKYKTSGAKWEDTQYLPQFLWNGGIEYQVIENMVLAPNVNYISKREGTTVDGTENNIDGYAVVNLVLKYQVNENLSVKLEGINLFDEEYTYPERVRNRIDYIPGGPERSGFVRVDYDF